MYLLFVFSNIHRLLEMPRELVLRRPIVELTRKLWIVRQT